MKLKMMLRIFTVFITSCFLSMSALAQDGSLDVTFDTDGMVLADMGGSDNGYGMAVQPDGKIIVTGGSGSGANDDFCVLRLNTNGSPDNTFDTDGKVTTSFGGGHDFGYAVAIQSDGKIVVAGWTEGGTYDIAVARYNTDGSLDNTFDTDGKVITAVGSGEDRAYAVAIQPDGKIVVTGHSHNGTNLDIAVVRYNTDGSLDNTFDGDGKLTTPVGTGGDNGRAVIILNDGRIVVAGDAFMGTSWDFALVRYSSTGVLDNTLDGDGKVTTDFGTSSFDKGNSASLQPDGKIVVAGYSVIGGGSDFAVARYNTDGSLDVSFDGDGKVTTAIGATNDDGFSVSLQADGKIVVGGSTDSADYNFAVVRYNTNGSLDNTFHSDGKVTTNFGMGIDGGYAVAVQSDGKILLGGFAANGGTGNDLAVVRYNSTVTGIHDPSAVLPDATLYPNPAGDIVMIGSEENIAKAEVYSIMGSLITTEASDNVESLNISGLSGGTYIVKLYTQKGESTSIRLIKK